MGYLVKNRTLAQKFRNHGRSARRIAAITLVTATLVALSFSTPADASTGNTVNLGTASNFSVLGRAVTSAGTTTLQQGLGTTSRVVIEAPPIVSAGRHVGDLAALTATSDLDAAYTRTSILPPDSAFAGDQANHTFTPGTYFTGAAFSLSGILTLDGGNNCGGIFIFQVNGALNTAAVSTVVLRNGAQASNVFWQVNGGTSIGANAHFVGTILGKGHITLGDHSTLDGRALTQRALTLTNNTIYLDAPISNCGAIQPTFGPQRDGTGNPGNAVTVNPTIGSSSLVPSTVRLVDGNTLVTSLTVAGEGTWSVQPDGSISFAPVAGFTGSPSPVNIVGRTAAGISSAPTLITITYGPVVGAQSGPRPVVIALPKVSG